MMKRKARAGSMEGSRREMCRMLALAEAPGRLESAGM